MTYIIVKELFKNLYKTKFINHNVYVMGIMEEYNISATTMRRWKRNGFDNTIDVAFAYCKSCDVFFKKEQSRQVCCGAYNCYLKHKCMTAKLNYKGKKKKWNGYSESVLARKTALRKVCRNRATKIGVRYSKSELDFMKKSKRTNFEVALELGRTLCSVENKRSKL